MQQGRRGGGGGVGGGDAKDKRSLMLQSFTHEEKMRFLEVLFALFSEFSSGIVDDL